MQIRILNKLESSRLVDVDNKTIHEWADKGKINKYVVKGCKTFKVSEHEVREAKEGRFVATYVDPKLYGICHYCEEDSAIEIDGKYLDICTVCSCKQ